MLQVIRGPAWPRVSNAYYTQVRYDSVQQRQGDGIDEELEFLARASFPAVNATDANPILPHAWRTPAVRGFHGSRMCYR